MAFLVASLSSTLINNFMLKHSHNIVTIALQLAFLAVEHVPVVAVESDSVCALQLVPHLPEDVSYSRVNPVVAPSRHDFTAFDGQTVLVSGVEHNGNDGSLLCVPCGDPLKMNQNLSRPDKITLYILINKIASVFPLI